MPVLLYEKEAEDRARVMLVHSQPEKLSPERRAEGIEIEELPAPPEVEFDKAALPYCNPADGSMWWELAERKLTPVEKHLLGRIDSLEARIVKLEGGREILNPQ